MSCEVKVGAGRSDPFEVSCGLRQGRILSLLFSLFIYSIIAKLKEAEVGVKCGSKLISMLLYANDAVIFNFSFNFATIELMKSENNRRDRMHPCLKAHDTSNGSLRCAPTFTSQLTSLFALL